MSLTRHLRDPGSPSRAYINGISPVLSDVLEGQAAAALGAAGLVQLAEIAARELLVPPVPGVDRTRAGTAVDFRTRIALGGFDAEQSAAAMGVALLDAAVGSVENGRHRARVLTEAFAVAAQLIRIPSDEADLDRAAIVLAHCEQVYRVGSAALKGSVGRALDAAADGQEFADAIDAPSLADLRCLMLSNAAQLDVWREQIAGGERCWAGEWTW